MAGDINKETRCFTRVRFSTRAEVEVNGIDLQGEVTDMSMGGIFVLSQDEVTVGDSCEVRIMLGNDDPMVIHALGHVVRRDANGFAVSFSGLYCDSDTSLRQVILHHADNRDHVEEEIRRGPKLTVIDPAS